jgi:DNA-binding LacI/PurR family transcriptional regulator
MANIREIAKRAGVSVTTVSRVLNNHPYVSTEKKIAVERVMKETGYNQNINAINLSKGKTSLIGVVVPFTNHPYFGLLVEGIAEEALQHSHKLVLIQTNYDRSREIDALQMLKHKQIDALIICSRVCGWSMIQEYIPFGQIVVCEDARGQAVSASFVDHYKSFWIALKHLHEHGHQKIGYCIGRKSGSNSKQREAAYKDFLKKHHYSYNSSYIFHNCYYFEDGEEVVKQFLKMNQPPTALLITSDQVAAGVLTSCKDNGVDVPGDLSIMGFDNQPISKVMKISTLEIPLVKMGRKLFLQAVQNTECAYEELKVQLIERATVRTLRNGII